MDYMERISIVIYRSYKLSKYVAHRLGYYWHLHI